VACSADGSGPTVPAGVDSWIAKWKVRRESPGDEERRQGSEDNRAAVDFRYVFAGGWSPDAHGFTTLILRDALEPRGVTLHALSSSPQSPDEPWTLTSALATFEATISSLPGDQPLRLIGASVGALLCALYAERHPGSVDSLFLISPVRSPPCPNCCDVNTDTLRPRGQTFNLRGCLERAVGGERGLAAWESLGVAKLDGMPVAFDVLEDIDAYRCGGVAACLGKRDWTLADPHCITSG
jgi:pimeloyl-ACP methyl ester carboxylesterase